MSGPKDTRLDGETPDGPDWGEDLFDNCLEFADNPEPRCPCVLLLDTSRSMAGEPLTALEHGLHVFRDELLAVPLAARRVEVAVVTFGASVEVAQDFTTADRFQPPRLKADGETPLGTGILLALDVLEERKARFRDNGVPYSRPWVFLITDGMPQGEPPETTRQAVQRVREAEASRKAAFYAVGVEGANMKLLARIAVRPPLKLRELRFAELFAWLSASTARAAAAPADDQVALPPIGWATDG